MDTNIIDPTQLFYVFFQTFMPEIVQMKYHNDCRELTRPEADADKWERQRET